MFLDGRALFPLVILLSTCRITNGDIQELLGLYKDVPALGEKRKVCSDYDYSPKECRNAKCNFQCATRSCSPEKNICARISSNPDEQPQDACSPHCYDVCNCRKRPYCEYDVAGGNCFKMFPEDGMELFSNMYEDWQCIEEGKHYIQSGVPHRAVMSSGVCDFVEQIRAVNLNGKNYTDERKIWYRADEDVPYLDEHNTRVPGIFEGDIEGSDIELHSTFVRGSKPQSLPDRCLTYVTRLQYSGYYELGIKMTEFFKNGTGQRQFTVKLNGIEILKELDLYKVLWTAYQPGDFILNFVVNNDHFLHLKGFGGIKLTEGRIQLSFCYGGCDRVPDTGYIVSAFHVLRIRSLVTPTPPDVTEGPPTTEPPGEDCSPEQYGRPQIAFGEISCLYPDGACSKDSDDSIRKKALEDCKNNNDTIDPTPGPDKNDTICRLRDGNPCACKMAGCEYNADTDICRWGETVCLEIPHSEADCRKEGTFSTYGGIICPSNAHRGNCNIKKFEYGVNLNGPNVTDAEGIIYQQDTESRYFDPLGIREGEMGVSCLNNAPILGVRPGEEEIYKNVIFGHPDVVNVYDSSCVIYPIRIQKGRYLLTIKTAELFVDKINSRIFTVKLSGIPILPNIDLVKLKGHCAVADFLVNFDISEENLVTVRGHTPIQILKDLLCIQFCFGLCEVPQKNFISSAFSLAMLRPVDSGPDGTSTTTEGFMLTSLSPEEPPPPGGRPSCDSFSDVVECKMHPCEWKIPERKCIKPPGDCNPRKMKRLTRCRRGDNNLMPSGGVICKAPDGPDTGDCTVKTVSIAVNLNGKDHSDSLNIPHVADMAYLYTDKENTRQPIRVGSWNRSQCKTGVTGIPPKDKELYSSLIFGKSAKRAKGRCITYHANITNDGRYELGIRTVETYYTNRIGNGRKPRLFNVRLNGMVILPEFNILHYAEPCQGIKIVAEFAVMKGHLIPSGLPPSSIADSGLVDIDFCYGNGIGKPNIDPNYLVSSFYIVELVPSHVTPPPVTSSPTKPTEPTEAPTEAPTETTLMTTTMTTTTKKTPPGILSTTLKTEKPVTGKPPVERRICGWRFQRQNFTYCTCPKDGCDPFYTGLDHPLYSKDGFECMERKIYCRDIVPHHLNKLFPGSSPCMRSRAAYAYGGTSCLLAYKREKYPPEDTNCTIIRQLLAIRFNGDKPYTDVRGITYTPMKTRKPDGGNYQLEFKSLEYIPGEGTLCINYDQPSKRYKDADLELWRLYVKGKPSSPPGACFHYDVYIPVDGLYELIVKTSEYEFTRTNMRAFRIFVNDQEVFIEVDVWRNHKRSCSATDLVAVFEVSDGMTMLTTRGFPATTIQDSKKVSIKFCKGRECHSSEVDRENYEFTGVAFSVVQLENNI